MGMSRSESYGEEKDLVPLGMSNRIKKLKEKQLRKMRNCKRVNAFLRN
jgi:hypothetical protein